MRTIAVLALFAIIACTMAATEEKKDLQASQSIGLGYGLGYGLGGLYGGYGLGLGGLYGGYGLGGLGLGYGLYGRGFYG